MVLVDVMNRDPRVHYPHDDVDELSSESDAEQQEEEEASQPEQPHVESGQRFDHELPTRHTVRILDLQPPCQYMKTLLFARIRFNLTYLFILVLGRDATSVGKNNNGRGCHRRDPDIIQIQLNSHARPDNSSHSV